MEEPIVDPALEFEAPQFVDFNEVNDDEEAYADLWFDGRPGYGGGIEIPVDVEEDEKPKESDASHRMKFKNVDEVSSNQEKPTDGSACVAEATSIAKENPEKCQENSTADDQCKIQTETMVDNRSTDEVVSESKHITESVDDGDTVKENKKSPSSVDPVQSEPPKMSENEISEDSLEEHVELDKEKSEIENINAHSVEKVESDNDSQKEGQTNTSENSESTGDEGQKNQQNEQKRRVTRAMKRKNRSLNSSSSNEVPSKIKKQQRASGGSTQTRRTRSKSDAKTCPTITIPVTPQCLKRQKTNKPTMIKLKTTEELEMECIAKLRKQTKHHIKANENTMKKALSCSKVNTARANGASPTRPQEFHFQTDRRVKQHPMATRADQQHDLNGEDVEKVFWNTLRQHPPSPSWKNRHATIPKPFNLSDGGQRKRKHSAMDKDLTDTDSYQSMAYQVYKFQTTTPPRFRTRKANDSFGANNDVDGANEKANVVAKSVTQPKTPNLSTKTRSRPVAQDVLSKEEREEKEIEEMKNYKFKAKPFDRRIIECDGMYGVKKPDEPTVATKPKPFVFESDERLELRKEKTPTENEEETVNFKAMPQPNFEKVFRPQLKHERTEPKPFSFAGKDKERWQKKEEKIQDVYREEEKLREFKAHPLPSDSPDSLPAVSSKCGTSFKPFALNTENRGARKAEKWIQKVKSELEECRSKATFKAKPCKVVHEAPFVPQRSKKPLTEVSQFTLNTNNRAERREELSVVKKEQEQIDEELRKEREAEREQEEQEALVLLRKQMVHKAQPIHKYKNVKVKPSSKPLTDAHSPAWSEMKRRRVDSHR